MFSTTPYATGRRAAAMLRRDPYGETDPIVSGMSDFGPSRTSWATMSMSALWGSADLEVLEPKFFSTDVDTLEVTPIVLSPESRSSGSGGQRHGRESETENFFSRCRVR